MELFKWLFRDNWRDYIEGTKNREHSPLLDEALPYVAHKDAACDLGAGGLRDTKHLLAKGFTKVTSVDSHASVERHVGRLGTPRAEAVITKFENYRFPHAAYDLVNAQLSLPFTHPDHFKRVFREVKGSLKSGGIFTGNLFGVNDEWNTSKEKTMTFLTRADVELLLSDMEVIKLEEIDEDGTTFHGNKPKHWHQFKIIARKR